MKFQRFDYFLVIRGNSSYSLIFFVKRGEKGHSKITFVLMNSAIMLAALMTACKTEDLTKRAENEEKLLKAMPEYPGNGLYDPAETVIGLDAPEPTEEELAEAEQRATEEKEAWQKAVGECFADGMFDTFYKEWFRTVYLGVAQANGLETAVTSFGIEDDASQDSDNIEHALITVIATDKDRHPNHGECFDQ